jgi:hypothetical protein
MIALSLTAPKFTTQEVQEERAQLSEDEQYNIFLDHKGWAAIPRRAGPQLKQHCYQLLQEGIDMIPDTEKTAYLRALQLCPDLVQSESHPDRFLLHANYDVWAAGRRLVKYWELRHRIFGNRAFFPMDLSGQGCLTPEEIELMRLGSVQILPKDNMGRILSYGNKSLLDDTPSAGLVSVRFATLMDATALFIFYASKFVLIAYFFLASYLVLFTGYYLND